ncbi:oligosaccharide flippase family protein [Pelotomaculum propionicicum]|uniref:oligosaccharide flippase family protein n=1 Tax=Pelotomaculum propionicicum TaxID=258475 RepID=UPI003B827830
MLAKIPLKFSQLRNIGSVLAANVFNNLTSFLITVFAARVLGPQEFGILAVAITITLLFSLFTDFGLNTALVRLYNAKAESEECELLPTIVGWKLLLVIVVIPAAFMLKHAAVFFFPNFAGYGNLLYFSFVSGALLSLWSTIRAVEQARREFTVFTRYTLAYGLLRIMSAGFLMATGKFSALGVLFALYAAPLTALMFYGWHSRCKTLWPSIIKTPPGIKLFILKRAFSYSFWVAISGINFTLLARVPQFTLGRSGYLEQVGLYSAGLTFIAVFSLLNEAVRTVLLPDVATLNKEEGRQAFRKKLAAGTPLFFMGGLIALAAMSLLQLYALGEAYSASVYVFIVLGAATMVTMYTGFYNLLVHSYGIPSLEAGVNIARVGTLVVLSWMLPSTAISAAFAYASVLVAGELLLYVLVKQRGSRQAGALSQPD